MASTPAKTNINNFNSFNWADREIELFKKTFTFPASFFYFKFFTLSKVYSEILPLHFFGWGRIVLFYVVDSIRAVWTECLSAIKITSKWHVSAKCKHDLNTLPTSLLQPSCTHLSYSLPKIYICIFMLCWYLSYLYWYYIKYVHPVYNLHVVQQIKEISSVECIFKVFCHHFVVCACILCLLALKIKWSRR